MFATEARADEATQQLVRAMARAWNFSTGGADEPIAPIVDALSAYAQLLLRWNARINLTAARSIDVLISEHYPDAFALARRLDGAARLIDVGSGGGLPAIPLALLRPALTVALVEPIAKKAAFLRTAARELGVGDRVSVHGTRGEKIADAIVADPGRAFDVAISRATLAPEKWLALGLRLVRPGGHVFVLTTPDALPQLADRDLYHDRRRALIQASRP
jgi:16S rRNA (guanine(527)-N(7))-methyltransferase RsmG